MDVTSLSAGFFLADGPIPDTDASREAIGRGRRLRSRQRRWGERSFVGNALGGLRGWSNLASWAFAGTLAYYLWVKPARQLQKEQEERAALASALDPYGYVEKRKPIPDPQDTGLICGKKKEPTKSDD